MQDLSIAVIQTELHWGKPGKNLEMFDIYLNDISDIDLIVLPEMFNTAFMVDPVPYAEKMDGPTMQWMKKISEEKNCVVTGSLIIKESSKFFNRLVWMQPDGNYLTYDKRHLFRMAGEDDHFSGGSKRLIAELKGWKVCPLICYDLRFPVWSKNRIVNGKYEYDLLIYVANWPEVRNQAWKSLLVARAIENQAYVVGVNRIGEDGNNIKHSGDTVILDPLGNKLTEAEAGKNEILSYTLDSKALLKYRNKFEVWRDWDNFSIIN